MEKAIQRFMWTNDDSVISEAEEEGGGEATANRCRGVLLHKAVKEGA